MLKNSYWLQNTKYSESLNRLWAEFVPMQGKAASLEGELLRAVIKIYYDYYNNGFLNDTSNFLAYLEFQNQRCSLQLEEELSFLRPYCKGTATVALLKENKKQQIEVQLESMVTKVIEYILSRDEEYTESSLDSQKFGAKYA